MPNLIDYSLRETSYVLSIMTAPALSKAQPTGPVPPTATGPVIPYQTTSSLFYSRLSKVSRMALMKSRLFRMTGFSQVEIRDRLLVIFPSSTVFTQASSSLSANAISALLPSSSPRLRSAPVQAKMVAMELVEVSSPFRCL